MLIDMFFFVKWVIGQAWYRLVLNYYFHCERVKFSGLCENLRWKMNSLWLCWELHSGSEFSTYFPLSAFWQIPYPPSLSKLPKHTHTCWYSSRTTWRNIPKQTNHQMQYTRPQKTKQRWTNRTDNEYRYYCRNDQFQIFKCFMLFTSDSKNGPT